MPKITDAIPVTMDTSYLPAGLNDLRGQGRFIGILNPVAVPVVSLVGSSPYKNPRVHLIDGAAAGTTLVEAFPATYMTGMLSFVQLPLVSVYHDDPVARNVAFWLRFKDPTGDVDISLGSIAGLTTNAIAQCPNTKTVVLNEKMQLVITFSGMAAGQVGHARYVSYEVPIGIVPEPSI